MRNRPWPLVLLALIQILTPVITVLFNAWAFKVEPVFVLRWIVSRPPLEIFETLALMPIAGIAIYLMKKWSYVVFIAAVGWSLIENLSHWYYAKSMLPLTAIIAIYGFQILLGLYFLLPSVRKTYFNPRVRWWESKPRYVLTLPAQFALRGATSGSTQPVTGKILNVSEGGTFAQVPPSLRNQQDCEVKFEVLSQSFVISGKVVHAAEVPARGYCVGIQFSHDEDTLKRMKGLVRALEALGFQDRVPAVPWLQSFVNWLATALRTGRGLTPELGQPEPRKRG